MSKLTELDRRYVLAIRVGSEYCPVDYRTGRICNLPHLLPTIFTSESRHGVIRSLKELGLAADDYKFIEVADQTLTPKESEPRLTVLEGGRA